MKRQTICLLIVILVLSVFTLPGASLAAPYYQGKTMKFIVGFSPGGGYDRMTRMLAKHLPKHIPGKPSVVVENMEGASSIIGTNYLFNIAKPDGLTIMLCFASVSMLSAQTLTYDASNFNADARKLQPAPTGHIAGKDNGPGAGLQNSGEDCGMCHTPNGKAGNVCFTIGGTIYEDRAARKPLKGAEVILQDCAGNVISMTTNDAGNFWTFAHITGTSVCSFQP